MQRANRTALTTIIRNLDLYYYSFVFPYRTQKRELGLAMMLLCVVTIFFLCNVLALVVNILEVHCNKGLAISPSLAGMSLTKLSLAGSD